MTTKHKVARRKLSLLELASGGVTYWNRLRSRYLGRLPCNRSKPSFFRSPGQPSSRCRRQKPMFFVETDGGGVGDVTTLKRVLTRSPDHPDFRYRSPKSISGALAVSPIEAKVVAEVDIRRARRVTSRQAESF